MMLLMRGGVLALAPLAAIVALAVPDRRTRKKIVYVQDLQAQSKPA